MVRIHQGQHHGTFAGRSRTLLKAGSWLYALCFCASSALAQPQKAELSAHLGYQWGGVVDETTKDNGVDSLARALGVHGAADFGLIFNVHITRTMHLEVLWDQQSTRIDSIDRAAPTQAKLTDLRVQYLHAGLVYNWSESKKQPFVGMTVGMTRYQAQGDFASRSAFSMAPVFGYKAWMSDHFGLRLHTRVFLTNVKAGELFTNSVTGWAHVHTKNTWSTQIQVGVALTLGR